MAGSSQEKTEQPTPKRKHDAKKKGEAAKSMEVNTALLLFGGVLLFMFVGPALFRQFEDLSVEVFGHASTYKITPDSLPALSWQGASYIMKGLMPFFAVMLFLGLIASFGQVGINVAEEALKPNWGKINPLKGMKQLFSMNAIVEVVKGLLKMGIVGGLVYLVLRKHLREFFVLNDQSIGGILNFVGNVAMELMLKVVIALLFLAAGDYIYQRFQFNKKLKMTKQEVKEEQKQIEGDPLIKSRIRSLQQEMARRRMMQEVPKADVIITNPTHYAIALRYNGKEMDAPVVIAKGMRKIAQRIKEIAAEHDIPLIENPPLARALYDAVAIGQEIPTKFYQAIAEVLAQIYRMKKA